MKPTAKWTFMVYMAGDNNLSDAGDIDLIEMRTIGSTADVNIVTEFDNAGNQGTRRYRIQRDGVNEPIEALGETDSGSPEVFTNFIAWAVDHYPAERYALVLWNHGSGWEPSEMDRVARSVGARDYNAREVSERSATPLRRAFFRTTLETIFKLPSPADRAICSDDGSGHSLDTIELGKALARVTNKLGRPLDLLGMDACLMSNLEVAYQIQPYVRYMVASEEEEPNDGWPYEAVLRELVAHPDLSTQDLATHIVRAYIKYYVDQNYSGLVTQSAFNLSRIKTVTEPLDKLAEILMAQMPEMAKNIWAAQRKSARFWHNTLWDISHFCEELEPLTTDNTISHATQAVRTALQIDSGNFVVAESHHGAQVDRCGGVTIYLLPALEDISRYYAELEYARNHRWLAMLKAYHAV
jgi:hypothetical protein